MPRGAVSFIGAHVRVGQMDSGLHMGFERAGSQIMVGKVSQGHTGIQLAKKENTLVPS